MSRARRIIGVRLPQNEAIGRRPRRGNPPSTPMVEKSFHREARDSPRDARYGERDEDDDGVAPPADLEGAKERFELVAGRARAPGGAQQAKGRDDRKRRAAAHRAALQPHDEEAMLELARDEAVIGADIVQHL